MTPVGGSAAETDRLPWLEPYREPPAAKRAPRRVPAKQRSSGRSWFLGGAVAAMIAFGGAGYWLGQRSESPVALPPQATRDSPASTGTTVALPEARSAIPGRPPEAEPNAAPPVEELPRASAGPSRPAAKAAKRTYRKKSARRSYRRRIRNAGLETDQLNSIREAQERTPAVSQPVPQPTTYRWPKLPSPGPAGRVVQLGAFSHPDRAYRTYHARLARYPSLARMPRVIVPVATGRNGRLLYVLRLGTSSRTQSKRLCRNLRRSGDHCIVIG